MNGMLAKFNEVKKPIEKESCSKIFYHLGAPRLQDRH